MNKLNKKGFTLVELLAVISIISLVLGLSTYGIINAYANAKEKGLAINNDSILEAARIYSTESSDYSDKIKWRTYENYEYFCTTIQRLKNAGLLKKDKNENNATITVKRDKNTSNILETKILTEDDTTLNEFCDIKFFTLHYDYNAGDEKGKVPSDQIGEICTSISCINLKISSDSPKRSGYKFMGWSTNKEGTGDKFKPGSDIGSPPDEGTTITLYAIWEEDNYVVNFNANTDNYTGTMNSITCQRDKNCPLPSNAFAKEGYTFTGWSTTKRGKKIYDDNYKGKNIAKDENTSITLYAKWESTYKVTVNYNVGSNSATIKSKTTYNEIDYYWRTTNDGTIERKKSSSGTYSSGFLKINYGSKSKLANYSSAYMKITNPGYSASRSSTWKCISGECNGKVYALSTEYSSDDFCNAKNNNCTVTLAVNWEQTLSPIITASDNINSGEWHNSPYTLTITSENERNYTYQYKVENGSYQTYESPISPPEGIVTYTARTKNNNSYSGTVEYISKLDTSKPSAPTIDNPSNENWTNENFSLTLHSTDSGSGIKYYQYKYANTEWKTYAGSASETFTTTPFEAERNELVYVRACDYAENCSDESTTYIRIDKTKPTISFQMLKDNTVVTQNGSYNSVNNGISWLNYKPKLKWIASDSDSGINKNIVFSYNDAGQSSVGTNITNTEVQLYDSNTYEREINSDGYRYTHVNICDNAGNCTISPVYFKIDTTKPNAPTITNPSGENWTSNPFALTLKSADGLSGISYYQYKYANTDWKTYTSSASTTYITTNFSAERDELAYLRACDKVGNCSDERTTYIRIDTHAPSVPTITNPSGGNWIAVGGSSSYPEGLKLTLKSSDNLSGISYYQYKYANTEWKTYDGSASTTYITTPFVAERNELAYLRACDTAKNCSKASSTQIRIGTSRSMFATTSSLKCRKEPNTSSATVATYNCGTSLSLIKTNVSDWYYNSSKACYISGSYLQSTTPNCGGGGSSGGSTNQNYYVILHRNCLSSRTCNFNSNHGAESITYQYNTQAYITSFPTLSDYISPNNFKVIGWYVSSPNSDKIITTYIDKDENGKDLYAYWIGKNESCSCNSNSDCHGANTTCNNGICCLPSGKSTCWG